MPAGQPPGRRRYNRRAQNQDTSTTVLQTEYLLPKDLLV